jgi:hypothetical protein
VDFLIWNTTGYDLELSNLGRTWSPVGKSDNGISFYALPLKKVRFSFFQLKDVYSRAPFFLLPVPTCNIRIFVNFREKDAGCSSVGVGAGRAMSKTRCKFEPLLEQVSTGLPWASWITLNGALTDTRTRRYRWKWERTHLWTSACSNSKVVYLLHIIILVVTFLLSVWIDMFIFVILFLQRKWLPP